MINRADPLLVPFSIFVLTCAAVDGNFVAGLYAWVALCLTMIVRIFDVISMRR